MFLLDTLTTFDIKSQSVKYFIYFGFLLLTPFMLIWNLLYLKQKASKIIGTFLPVSAIIFILVIGPLQFLFSIGAWKTQTILFEHKNHSFKTIEFQMQDVGALGYNNRTVQVLYLTPLFMITDNVPIDLQRKQEWCKVEIEVNEQGLK